ncbi:MAG: hypothetical protein JW908_04325 [Anaerolineales bacterium]|nr:hypothetical protein [Anaerolineales bacterium]
MAKKYTKQTWVDEELAEDASYEIIDDNEEVFCEHAEITLATDVAVAGSPVNAERMNHIEDGIDDVDDALVAAESAIDDLEAAIDELEVAITDATDGDILSYDSVEEKWVNNQLPPDMKIALSAIRIYKSNDTWTKPENLHHIIVEVLGAGGGGGGVVAESGKVAVAGGGGPGGYSKKRIDAADLGSTETVTVGSKGAKGAAGNNNGSVGETSSFGSHCSATGGSGGYGQAAFSTVARRGGACGTSGIGSDGDINAAGAVGPVGSCLNLTTSGVISGGGGNSLYGAGGNQRTSEGAGNDGSGYGAGGGGACSVDSTTNFAGADGTDGLVIVWEYTEVE